MSAAQLAALRADLNPAWGVLWDMRGTWYADDGHRTITASSPDQLRRRVRAADGTTEADTQTWKAETC